MGNLGEAVPVPLVLSEPHTLGAGVSTVVWHERVVSECPFARLLVRGTLWGTNHELGKQASVPSCVRVFVCSFRGLFACVLSWVQIL